MIEKERILSLKNSGLNKTQIAKITNVPRSTIRDWFETNKTESKQLKKSIEEILIFLKSNDNIRKAYSYILGLYLGDGYINKTPRSYRLRIALDKKYKKLNKCAENNLRILFPSNKIGIVNFKNHINLSVYSNELTLMIPQHGIGEKYTRDVSLKEWQESIIDEISLLKGLFHSDGCFYEETIKEKYTYNRFCFTNKSKDIQNIFQSICYKNSIQFDVQTNKLDISIARISRKKSVAKLKQLIGIKE